MLELTRLEFIDVKAAVHTFLLESRTKPDHGTITPLARSCILPLHSAQRDSQLIYLI